jgi:lysophospholipase L1-like esterase
MNKFLLVLNVFVVVILGFIVFKKLIPKPTAITLKTSSCVYDLKSFKFHYEKEPQSPNVVMLGNSLMEMANWNAVLHRDDVINRGIDGDYISCIAQRMNYLQNIPARICFIEAGIDDLRNNNADTAFYYYKKIVRSCQEQHKIPVINLVLFISPKAVKKWGNRQDYKSINKSVLALNAKLKEYALLNGIDFIDMNPEFSTENVLTDRFTTDGINLTDSAYSIWARKIASTLANHGI